MGCSSYEYLEGTVVAVNPIVLRYEGQEHVHQWGHWGPVEEHQVLDNRFYDRRCANCGAIEETEGLREVGKTVFFDWKEAR